MRQETDFAYFQRRAGEEKVAAQVSASEEVRARHAQLSEQYSILAEMIRHQRLRVGANDNP